MIIPALFHRLSPALLLALMLTFARGVRGDAPSIAHPLATRMRGPVALAPGQGRNTLLVANRKSGTVSVIDTAARRVVGEYEVGQGLADLAPLPDGRHLLAVDQAAGELLLIDGRDPSMRIVGRTKVGPDPIQVVVSADGSFCIVASLWSRQLAFVGLVGRVSTEHPALLGIGRLDVPFCPRGLALTPDSSRLVVTDAFGGRLAVIDTNRRVIESVRSLPAHNIRGLAFAPDGQTLIIAHQVLSRLAQASFDDVHWGLLIRNQLRVLKTNALLNAGSDAAMLAGSRSFDLGDVGDAAGDPADLAVDPRGRLLVALAGVDEIAITASPDQAPRRIAVGRRPTAVLPSLDGTWAYVADTLDDTVSVVEIATGRRAATISLGPRPEPTPADRGERLFFDAKLSHDGWMSCQSCHTDGHTNSLLCDTLGDGSYGAPKRVPSLLGVAATGPWTWTGSLSHLEDQVRKSITTTMQGAKPTDTQVADLTAYLSSLAPPAASVIDIGPTESAAVARGRAVFEARKCDSCHVPPEYTSPARYDVGLVDEVGNHEFNPPSLRGVGRRDALLHDNRAGSLEDVFQKVQHPRRLELTSREIADLIAFLKTL